MVGRHDARNRTAASERHPWRFRVNSRHRSEVPYNGSFALVTSRSFNESTAFRRTGDAANMRIRLRWYAVRGQKETADYSVHDAAVKVHMCVQRRTAALDEDRGSQPGRGAATGIVIAQIALNGAQQAGQVHALQGRIVMQKQAQPLRQKRTQCRTGNDSHWTQAAQPLPEIEFEQPLAWCCASSSAVCAGLCLRRIASPVSGLDSTISCRQASGRGAISPLPEVQR